MTLPKNDTMSKLPAGQVPNTYIAAAGPTTPHFATEKGGNPDLLEAVQTNQTDVQKEVLRHDLVASLGIPDWQAKERKIVRRLDMTLLPQLWVLYMAIFYSIRNPCDTKIVHR